MYWMLHVVGVPADQQRLLHKGRALQEEKTLLESDIQKGKGPSSSMDVLNLLSGVACAVGIAVDCCMLA